MRCKDRQWHYRLPAKKCVCGNIITRQRIYCPANCYCAMCLLRHYVKDTIRLCPKCNAAVVGDLPESVQCSGCFRPLQPLFPPFQSSVFDVFPRGCILCCYCVLTDGALGNCPCAERQFLHGNGEKRRLLSVLFPVYVYVRAQ